MQVVGKIQAVTPGDEALSIRSLGLVDAWAGAKFSDDGSGFAVIRRNQSQALFDRKEEEWNGQKLFTFEVLEPVGGGELQTQVRILSTPERLHFNCTISLEAERGLAPPDVNIYAPRFVRDVIGLSGCWQFAPDAENLIARFIDVDGDDVDTFLQLLETRQRRLPLVVISEFDGRTIAGDLHVRVANDLCGLAHTCRLSREAAWAITERLDKEWSVYNGAVRLFWPFRANREHPRNHPLWTFDALTRHGDPEVQIRDRMRQRLRETLLEASTFLADDPAFGRFVTGRERSARDDDRRAQPDADQANSEIKDLRSALDARDVEIKTL